MARTIPLWIVTYMIFHIVLEVGLGTVVWIDPSIQFGDGAAVASFPVGFYAVRSIAVGIVMAAALFAGETKILASLFLVRLITDILDLVLVFTGSPPAAMAAVSPPAVDCHLRGALLRPGDPGDSPSLGNCERTLNWNLSLSGQRGISGMGASSRSVRSTAATPVGGTSRLPLGESLERAL